MMRWLALAITAVFAFAGCSNEEPPPPPPTYSTETSTETPSETPTTTYTAPSTTQSTESLPPIGKKAIGANAAPTATAVASQFYDNSAAAAQRFGFYWQYEMLVDADADRGVNLAYTDGVGACLSRAKGVGSDATVKVLKDNRGWTGTGAAAIYASALRSLCTGFDGGAAGDYRIDGYKTKFDENVALAYPVITSKINFTGVKLPTIYDVGWIAKFACWHLENRGNSDGLLEWLLANSNRLYLVSVGNQRTTEIATYESVLRICPAMHLRLGYGWSN